MFTTLQSITEQQALNWGRVPVSRMVAAGFAALAAGFSLLALAGWLLDVPGLRGFGLDSYPIWPLTALGYLLLSLGFLAGIADAARWARVLWAPALAIAVLALAQSATGVDLGIDRLLFADAIGEIAAPHPGRPGVGASTILILLALAGYAGRQQRWLRDEAASLLATAALALAAAAVVLVLLSSAEAGTQPFGSLPDAVIALSLGVAFIAWNSGFGWAELLTAHRPGWRLVRLLLPLVLLLPLAPALLAMLFLPSGETLPVAGLVAIVTGNILIVALVAYGAMIRVARDQAEMADAMAALRASEDRLAEAAAVHELGVFEWNVATGRLEWSPGTEQRLGVVPGSMPDLESWAAQIHAEDLADIMQTLGRAAAERAPKFSYRYRFLHPNGDVRAIEGTSRAFYDDQGALVRTIGVLVDTSERDDREAELRRREAQLRSVLQTVPDAMVVTEADGTIRQFSAAAEALWGYRAADMLGRKVVDLAPADERDRLGKLLRLGGGKRLGVVQGTGESIEGRRFPVEIRTGRARTDGQTLFTIFFRDLTDRLASEERLSELNAELAHVSRQTAMSELAADLAHELNQPLSAIANFLAAARMLIEKGEDAERIGEMLRMGSEQTQRAGQIIRRLRDFTARGEVGVRPESLEAIVREATELVLVGTRQFHIEIACALHPAVEYVEADRVQIQQVLVNLLRNAMQALRTVEGARRIAITSRPVQDNMVEIAVTDTGPGIAASVLETLFERFATTKRDSGGMGIGLSISKRIVEAHGGRLSAGNRPEGGASFRFTLPIAEESEEP